MQHRNFGPCHKILEDPHIKTYLTELQSKYVLVPADKADNNIIFVCKYYYIRTLMEELGIDSGTNLNSAYINQDHTVDEVIQTHATTIAHVFNFNLQQKEKNLPQILIGLLNFTRHHTRQGLLPVHVHALQLGSPN